MTSATPAPDPESTLGAFATNVRVQLARRDWKLEDLTARLEPPRSHHWIRRRLSGEAGTTLTDLDRIAVVLDTTSVELLKPADRPAYFPGGEA